MSTGRVVGAHVCVTLQDYNLVSRWPMLYQDLMLVITSEIQPLGHLGASDSRRRLSGFLARPGDRIGEQRLDSMACVLPRNSRARKSVAQQSDNVAD